MSKSLKLIAFLILSSSCIDNNPEKVVEAIHKIDCKTISVIEISDGFNDGKRLSITDQESICDIYNLTKKKMNLPNHDFLPLNQNIESVDLMIYNIEGDLLFEILTGKFNSNSGYILVLEYKVNSWLNMKRVRDIEFPERMISTLNASN